MVSACWVESVFRATLNGCLTGTELGKKEILTIIARYGCELALFFPGELQGDIELTRDSLWKRLEVFGIPEERKLEAFPELVTIVDPEKTLTFNRLELFNTLWDLGFDEWNINGLFRDLRLEGEDLAYYNTMLQEFLAREFPG